MSPSNIYFVIIFLFAIIKNVSLEDYCDICNDRTHTMCKYAEGPAESCYQYKTNYISLNLKKYIISIHNDIRQYVASGNEEKGILGQPPAGDMLLLEWDDELAAIAQRWADQCIQLDYEFQHDQCRKTSQFEVGQNILTAVTQHNEFPNLNLLILKWYYQVVSVTPSDIQHFPLTKGKHLIGKYTQLVWAKTHYVGCGMASYKNPNATGNDTFIYFHRLVCNYAPSGNVIGAPVYQIGQPCSKCSKGTTCDTKRLLCVANKTLYKSREKQNNTEAFTVTYKLHVQDILSMNKIVSDLYELEGGVILQDEEEVFGKEDYLNSNSSDGQIDPRTLEMNEDEYQIVSGIWFEGICRCNLVYRSSDLSILFKNVLILCSVNVLLVAIQL